VTTKKKARWTKVIVRCVAGVDVEWTDIALGGLAVTRHRASVNRYTITHVRSGRCVPNYKATKANAVRRLKALLGLKVRWLAGADEVVGDVQRLPPSTRKRFGLFRKVAR
jgi:hypothetical protein